MNYFFGGAKETFGRCPAPKIGLDKPLVGSETGVCDCVIGRRECSAAGTVNETDDMQLEVWALNCWRGRGRSAAQRRDTPTRVSEWYKKQTKRFAHHCISLLYLNRCAWYSSTTGKNPASLSSCTLKNLQWSTKCDHFLSLDSPEEEEFTQINMKVLILAALLCMHSAVTHAATRAAPGKYTL